MAGADVVVHLAALTGVGQSIYESREYTDVNCIGTSVVLAEAAAAGVQRVILASSRAVYGEGPYECAAGDIFTGIPRGSHQLHAGQWDGACPVCTEPASPRAASEDAAVVAGSVYGGTKVYHVSVRVTITKDHHDDRVVG